MTNKNVDGTLTILSLVLLLELNMRAAVVFFLSLCFLLSGGYVYAGAHQNGTCYLPAQHIEKIRQTKFGNVNQGLLVIKNNSLSEKKEDLSNVEDDDSDDFVFSRKYVLLTRYFITLAYASVLIYFYNYFKSRLPFCKHLSYASSYKYILQRVLRL